MKLHAENMLTIINSVINQQKWRKSHDCLIFSFSNIEFKNEEDIHKNSVHYEKNGYGS